MTDQPDLDRLLVAYFAEGTNELADRVIDAALDQIVHTRQRRPLHVPRRSPVVTMPVRLAAAAVIGVLAVGGAFYLLQPGKSAVGGPGPSPSPSAVSSQAAATPTPTATPANGASPTPNIPGLTGSLGAGRQIQTATILADGRVLVAGGFDNKDLALASAVVYDPATNRFSPTGSMTAARGLGTATLLTDGRVLITGGGHASWTGPQEAPFLASAEFYDPKVGTFSPTGSMSIPREDHTATRLADGRVLIVGGDDTTSHGVASAEIYDPKTGAFSPTGSLATARGFHTATLLADGRVLIAGGDRAAWTPPDLDTAEIYDPKTGTFTATGAMATARTFHAATLLPDGRVLVVGGTDGVQDLASAELYDPKTGTFTASGSMVAARVYHTATLLPDGRVLVAGGGSNYANGQFLASAELFDPKTGSFTATGSMKDARTYHTASLLADGRVLVAGGYGALAPLPTAEIFDPKTGAFSPAGSGG